MFEIKPREIIPIIKDIAVGGVVIKSAPPGGMAEIAQKMFTTSFDNNFETTANHLISLMLGGNRSNDINQLLALIKPDNKAYIYTDYPFGLTARCKRDVQGGTFVYESDIADIESVAFDMGDFVFDFQYGDKVVWLFRSNWKFGLYFDMTQESTKKDIYTDMGTAYKLLKYYDLYTFLEDEINFNQLICDGWFPFIELMGKEYKKLLSPTFGKRTF